MQLLNVAFRCNNLTAKTIEVCYFALCKYRSEYLHSVKPIEMTDFSSLFLFVPHPVRFSIEALTTYQGAKANSPTGGS